MLELSKEVPPASRGTWVLSPTQRDRYKQDPVDYWPYNRERGAERERERERDWIFYLSGHAGSRESIISKKVDCDFICLSMYLKWVI